MPVSERMSANALISELGGDEQESRFENAQTRGDRNGIEILDAHVFDLFVFVLNGHLEQVTVFALEEEEERSLRQSCEHLKRSRTILYVYLHLVHDCSDNQDTTIRVLQRMIPTGYWDTMCWSVHVSVYDVVLTTDEDSGRPIKSLGRRKLTTWHLDKQVRA